MGNQERLKEILEQRSQGIYESGTVRTLVQWAIRIRNKGETIESLNLSDEQKDQLRELSKMLIDGPKKKELTQSIQLVTS